MLQEQRMSANTDMPPVVRNPAGSNGEGLTQASGDGSGFEPEVLLRVLSRVQSGDFSAQMPVHWIGVPGKIADRLNEIIGANQAFSAELERVSRVVGKEGKLSQRVSATL